MSLGRVRHAVLVWSSALICLTVAVPSRAQEGSHGMRGRNEEAVLRYLGPALASVGKGALLYYQGDCRESDKYPVAFPQVSVQPPSKRTRGLAAVQGIFRHDKNVTVTERRSGIIRIRIGNAPATILQTRIAHLTLSPLERDFPRWTLYKIENTKDVEGAMRKLSFKSSPFSPGLVNVVAPPDTPHLPSSMNGVTMEQVLELTAKTFKGIVIYGACTRPSGQRLFRLDFVDIAASSGASPSATAKQD